MFTVVALDRHCLLFMSAAETVNRDSNQYSYEKATNTDPNYSNHTDGVIVLRLNIWWDIVRDDWDSFCSLLVTHAERDSSHLLVKDGVEVGQEGQSKDQRVIWTSIDEYFACFRSLITNSVCLGRHIETECVKLNRDVPRCRILLTTFTSTVGGTIPTVFTRDGCWLADLEPKDIVVIWRKRDVGLCRVND